MIQSAQHNLLESYPKSDELQPEVPQAEVFAAEIRAFWGCHQGPDCPS